MILCCVMVTATEGIMSSACSRAYMLLTCLKKKAGYVLHAMPRSVPLLSFTPVPLAIASLLLWNTDS